MKKLKFLSVLTLMFFLGAILTSCTNVKDSDLEETATQIISSNPNATNVSVSVLDNVATLNGTVENDATKSRVQSSIMAIEGIKSVINGIKVVPPPPVYVEPVVEEVSNQLIVATRKGKLNVHNKPGVQEHVIAVVEHGEILTLIEKVSEDWWLIQTENGLQGYSAASYLEQQQ